ncbi:hypothetical protein BH10BAC2_BH10BAC2_49130 [soil metagenome]
MKFILALKHHGDTISFLTRTLTRFIIELKSYVTDQCGVQQTVWQYGGATNIFSTFFAISFSSSRTSFDGLLFVIFYFYIFIHQRCGGGHSNEFPACSNTQSYAQLTGRSSAMVRVANTIHPLRQSSIKHKLHKSATQPKFNSSSTAKYKLFFKISQCATNPFFVFIVTHTNHFSFT